MSTARTTNVETGPTGLTTTTTTSTTDAGEGGLKKEETEKVVEAVEYRSPAGDGPEEMNPVAVVHEYSTGGKDDSAAAPPLKQD